MWNQNMVQKQEEKIRTLQLELIKLAEENKLLNSHNVKQYYEMYLAEDSKKELLMKNINWMYKFNNELLNSNKQINSLELVTELSNYIKELQGENLKKLEEIIELKRECSKNEDYTRNLKHNIRKLQLNI